MKVQTCGHTLPCPFPSPFQRRKKSGIISQFFFQLETGLQNRYGPVRSHHPPKKTPVWGCLICGNTPKTPLWGGLDQGRPGRDIRSTDAPTPRDPPRAAPWEFESQDSIFSNLRISRQTSRRHFASYKKEVDDENGVAGVAFLIEKFATHAIALGWSTSFFSPRGSCMWRHLTAHICTTCCDCGPTV
jgi:hypothetical protein